MESIISFIRSAFYEPENFIPLHDPRFIGNEKQYLNECIDSNFVSSVGEFVGRFEKMCADYIGAKYVVATMNGTSALHIALLLAGVKPCEEVISQPLTFVATTNAISYIGASPVFTDVNKETMGLCPYKLREFLQEFGEMRLDGYCYNKQTGKRFAACVPMHTFGHPVIIDKLIEVCNEYNIPVIEDAAESLGSYYKERHTGTSGLFGILSFNGNKVITTGGGGMILTNDEELAKKAKHITTTAKIPHSWEFFHDQIGYNYRMTNIQAALGCAQIENLDYFIEEKRQLAERYKEFFKTKGIEFFTEPENCKSNYWLNVIIMNNKQQRDEFLKYTNEHGVMTRPIWTLMNALPAFSSCQCGNIDNAKYFEDRVVNIPSSVIIKDYFKN
ncbi:MAG: LegC family aminotransferase [Prevotellaceae bacterium]|jgi:aminotransferase in exopolysaccharide biosynthesis|nr:LegC family aminotransferase [Prevotellaceae bacterium]